MTTLDQAILALVQRASEQAILPYYQRLDRSEVQEKAAGDLVTIADHQAEAILTEGLAALEPELAIIGEEAAHKDPSLLDHLCGDCWIVDPLDGTHNFAQGQPHFGLLIARAQAGVAQSGWIYDCLTGRFCLAHRGQGAWRNGVKVQAQSSGQKPAIAAISTLYMDQQQAQWIENHIAPHYHLVDIPRCAAEQYPRLALGQNDVSLFERTLPWDHAAGVLWLNEAGGKAARYDGAAYRVDQWEQPGLIGAASPQLWEDMASRIGKGFG